ncbi:MAG: DUF1513 domain-containing protein [Gemmataceae bacterium]|nr:DUF1513 domain-containing protein [Gemmataceae bacterium]
MKWSRILLVGFALVFGHAVAAQALHRFGTSRFCTQAEVVSLVLSHDGKLLAAVDRDGRVYLWDADTGKERMVTVGESGKRVAISPDGHWLAFGEDAPFEVHNLRKKESPRLPIGNAPRVFAFSPDSKSIAIAMTEEADIVLYEIEGGKELRRYAGLVGTASALAFSPDGKLLASGKVPIDVKKKLTIVVVVWDALKGDKLKEFDQAGKQVRNFTFLPDNKTLLGQVGARMIAWDAKAGVRLPKLDQSVGSSYAIDSAGKTLATTDGPKVMEFGSDKVLHEFDTSTLIRHLAMSGDGKLLAACPSRFESASPRLLLWDLTTGKEQTTPEAHRHYVDAVAFSHDGKTIATAANVEGVARVWDARSAKLLHTLNLETLKARSSGGPRSRRTLTDGLAFSVDRPEIFIGGQRWDLTTGKPIELKADDDFRFEQTNSYRAVLTADGRRAASFLNGHALLFWNPATAKTIQRLEPAGKTSYGEWSSVVFSGKLAITGKWFLPRKQDGEDPLADTLHVWDIAAGKSVKSFRPSPTPIVRLMLSPDAETLAVIGFPNRLELWHLPSGRLLREMYLADIENLPRTVSLPTLAFAPHGQWFAFAHLEGETVLLETMTGKEINVLKGHRGYVSGLAFSPDSRRLLSGGRDTTALVWSLMPASPALPANWKDAEKLWLDLGGSPEHAYRVVWPLLADPKRAIEVLAKRLEADGGATDKEITLLVANLAAPKFAQRDVAIRRLKQIGPRSFPALEQALKKAPDLETARRIQELLKTVETSLTPETLRDLRGLQILELLATPESRQVLAQVAAGDASAAKTRLAQSALERLKATTPK